MQTEVEVKFLEIDKDAMEQKLLSLGAKKVFDADMKQMHFMPLPDGIGLIRVRQEGDACFFVVKERVGKGLSLITHEYSVGVDDFDAAIKILYLLGYKQKHLYEKHRTSYVLGDVRFEFDKLMGMHAHIPVYLEIEARDEAGVKKAIALLGLSESDAKNWTSGKVVRFYGG